MESLTGPNLTRKHYTSVDGVYRGKHTSLQFRNSNYEPKTFYRIGAMTYTIKISPFQISCIVVNGNHNYPTILINITMLFTTVKVLL